MEARQPTGERFDFNALCLATDDQLEDVIRKSSTPDQAGLVGWEFKGYYLSEAAALAGMRKFKLGFYLEDPGRDPALGIEGFTAQIHPNTLGEPWIDKTRRGEPIRHSWFELYPVSLSDVDNKYPNGLLLNYGLSAGNFLFCPGRVLRAYVAQVYVDNADLLLGKMYAALGAARVFLSFFALERHNESTL